MWLHQGLIAALRIFIVVLRLSLLVVHMGLSSSAASETLISQPRMEPPSPALQGRFSTTGPLVKSLRQCLKDSITSWYCQGP